MLISVDGMWGSWSTYVVDAAHVRFYDDTEIQFKKNIVTVISL
jgi:hypothetical protein